MAFTHTDKVPGDLIRSADWNDMGREVTRLNSDKVDLAGNQMVTGPLTVRADLAVGTANTGAQLRVLRRQENGADAASHGALVVGTDSATSASLRVGYDQGYSWLQGQGRQNLALNPRGGDVGVGTDNPRSKLSVAGGVAVGAAYAAANAAPASSLIVEGNLGVGTPTPQHRLHVEGNGRIGGGLDVTGSVNFGTAVRQMVNLWGTGFGIGVQSNTTYFRSDSHFAFFRGGTHADAQLTAGANGAGLMSILSGGNVGVGTMDPQARLQVTGGAIMPAAGAGEAAGILFSPNPGGGGGDSAWMRYYARAGESTTLEIGVANDADDHISLMSSGSVGIGTLTPLAKLHVEGGARVAGGLDVTGALTAASGKVNGALEVTGALTAASGKVNGALEVTGALTAASGKVTGRLDVGTVVVGTGGLAVGSRLQVNGAAIMPATGNNLNAGIMFPWDAFGGGGDAAWLRYYARSGEAATLELGIDNDADDHIALMASGNVGIGNNNPSKRFTVRQPGGGNGFRLEYGSDALNIHWEEGNHNVVFYRDNGIGRWMDTAGNWNHNSDLALKDEVVPIDDALADVLRLRPVRFRWKHNGQADLGLIAQEVEEVFPQLVGRLDDGSRGLAYDSFGVVAIAALQELARVVDEQERRIGELTRQVNGKGANA